MERIIVASREEVKTWIQEVIREELPNLMSKVNSVEYIDEAPLMTRAEIAKYLKISLVTLTDWVKRGVAYTSQAERRTSVVYQVGGVELAQGKSTAGQRKEG